MCKLFKTLLKVGTTVATVVISNACGVDKNMAIAIGSVVGSTVSGIFDLSNKDEKEIK